VESITQIKPGLSRVNVSRFLPSVSLQTLRKIMQTCLDHDWSERGLVHVSLRTCKGNHKDNPKADAWVIFDDTNGGEYRLYQENFGIEQPSAEGRETYYILLQHVEEEIRIRKVLAGVMNPDGSLVKRRTNGAFSTEPSKVQLDALAPGWRDIPGTELYFFVCDRLRKLPADELEKEYGEPISNARPAPVVEVKSARVEAEAPANDPIIEALRAIGKPATKHQILATGKVKAAQWSMLLSDAYKSRKVRRHESSDATNVYHTLV